MPFDAHSQSRVRALHTAVDVYTTSVHQSTHFFDFSHIEDLPSQSRLRSDPLVTKNLTQLDAEIELVLKIEQDLQRARNRLHQWRARTRNILTPISFLPNEILGYIFTCDLPMGRELIEFTESISRVCQHWRAVAIQHSVLWTAIDLRWHVPRQNTWVSRAGDRPLSAILEFPAPPGMLEQETWDGFDVMASQVHWQRWRSLDLYLTEEAQMHLIFDYLSTVSGESGTTGLPNLTSLNLIKQGNHDVEDDGDVFFFDMAFIQPLFPNLQSLTTYHVYAERILNLMPTLVTLKTNTVGAHSSDAGAVGRWLDIFRACTRLEDLEADWNRAGWTLHRPTEMPRNMDLARSVDNPPAIVPHLHTLRLRWIDWRVCRRLLCRLHLPALRFLSVEMDPVTFQNLVGPEFVDCTAAFFSEAPLLETAEFKGYGTFLALILRGMTDGSSSAASSTSAMMLPNLAHLVLDTFDDGDFTAYAKELVAFLDRRIEVKKALELGTGAGPALWSLRLRHSQCSEREKTLLLKKIGIVSVDVCEDDVAGDSFDFEGIPHDDDKDGTPPWNPNTNDVGAPPDNPEDDWDHAEDSSYTDDDAIQDESEASDGGDWNTDDDFLPGWGMGMDGHFLELQDDLSSDTSSISL